MRRIVILIFVLSACLIPLVWTQAPTTGPSQELQKLKLWAGVWLLEGTAKDTPTEPEYKLEWRMEGRWILGGRFLEVRGMWKGKSAESGSLEVLTYHPARRIHTISGFADDGTTWVATVTFTSGVCIETGTDTGPDGKIATWRNTWIVSPDGMSISGKEEREQGGVHWTAFTVKGTRTKPPAGNL
jgi:hypothetical protein